MVPAPGSATGKVLLDSGSWGSSVGNGLLVWDPVAGNVYVGSNAQSATSNYTSPGRGVFQVSGASSALLEFQVNGTNTGYIYATSAETRVSSVAGNVTFWPSNALAATISSAGLVLAGGAGATIGSSPHTYGSVSISGSLGGYSGIQFPASYGTLGRTFMVSNSAAIQGVYDSSASAWDWYFNAGVLTVGTVPGASVTGTVANATTAATVSTTVASAAVGTTQAVATNNTTIATTAFAHLAAGGATTPAVSLAVPGGCTFSNGLILKWGSIAASADPHTVTYAAAFPTGALIVIGSATNTSGGNSFEIDTGITFSASQFGCFTGGAGAYWLALGH